MGGQGWGPSRAGSAHWCYSRSGVAGFCEEGWGGSVSAEPRLAHHRETESGQRVPWLSQLQPLHRAGGTANHSSTETPYRGGMPCLWTRLKGICCSHPCP